MGRVAVKLFRDATEVDAGAAHGADLGQCHAGAALRGHARGAHAAAAAADHKEVKVKSLHLFFLLFLQDWKSWSSFLIHSMNTRVRLGSRRACG